MSQWTEPPYGQDDFGAEGPRSFESPRQSGPWRHGERPAGESPTISDSSGGPVSSEPLVAGPPNDTWAVNNTFTRLVWLLASLVVVYFLLHLALPVVRQYSYASARARVDAALDGLKKVGLNELSLSSRLVNQVVSPSVVHISTSQTVSATDVGARRPLLFGMPHEYHALGQGSGVIVDPEGYIVTNNHVIEGAEEISVHLSDGRQLEARIVGYDALTDLAVLKIDADGLIAAQWGDSDQIEQGDMVWAFGSPFGLEQSVTFGIVSAKGRTQQTRSQFQEYLQTDVAVNPGNSGGPLVNNEGKIVGINTAIVGQAYQGISFAVPSAIVKKVYTGIRDEGSVSRGWLGVKFPDRIDSPFSGNDKLRDGAIVERVVLDSPADHSGLEPGDLIVGWDGKAVDNPRTLSRLVARTDVGSTVSAEVIRDGKRREVTVTIERRTDPIRLNYKNFSKKVKKPS